MRNKLILVAMLIMSLLVVAGCGGGGSDLKRQTGLSPEQVVHTFFNAAKDSRLNEATLYVSPVSAGNTSTVVKFVTGQDSKTVKNSNLLAVKKVAQQGDYAVVMATLQQTQNSASISFKPVGLERINGEWYIIDTDSIYSNLKYQVLAQLLKGL